MARIVTDSIRIAATGPINPDDCDVDIPESVLEFFAWLLKTFGGDNHTIAFTPKVEWRENGDAQQFRLVKNTGVYEIRRFKRQVIRFIWLLFQDKNDADKAPRFEFPLGGPILEMPSLWLGC